MLNVFIALYYLCRQYVTILKPYSNERKLQSTWQINILKKAFHKKEVDVRPKCRDKHQ